MAMQEREARHEAPSPSETQGEAEPEGARLPAQLWPAAARFGVAAVQRRLNARRASAKSGDSAESSGEVAATAARGVGGGAESLPHGEKIQQAFGRHDVSGVKAHTGGDAARAAESIGAEAYATGDHVAFSRAPDLHTAAHEAAHVVQQRAGVHLKGGVGEEHDEHERHADAVADQVVRGGSAEGLLDRYHGGDAQGANGGVQKKFLDGTQQPIAAEKAQQLVEGFRGSSHYLKLQRMRGIPQSRVDETLEELAHGARHVVQLDLKEGLLSDGNYAAIADRIFDIAKPIGSAPSLDDLLREIRAANPAFSELLKYPPTKERLERDLARVYKEHPESSLAQAAAQVVPNLLLGEAHDDARTRAFVRDYAGPLHALGFETLVIEYDGSMQVGDILGYLIQDEKKKQTISPSMTLQQLCDAARVDASLRPYLKEFMVSTFACDIGIAEVCVRAMEQGFQVRCGDFTPPKIHPITIMNERDTSFASVIASAVNGGSKTMLLVGAHHLKATVKKTGRGSNSPGIPAMLAQRGVDAAEFDPSAKNAH